MGSNPSLARHPALDDWLAVSADGRVTVRSGKVDIGQHISTALALIAADELDVDPARIDLPRAQTGIAPDEGVTSGSNSMEESGEAVRLAAATARRHLLSLAAHALDVDVAALEVEDGLVQSRATNRSITYWELLGGARFAIDVDANAVTKPPDAYRHIGRRAVARDMATIVTGKAHFVHDMQLAGMLHARIVRRTTMPGCRKSMTRLPKASATAVCNWCATAASSRSQRSTNMPPSGRRKESPVLQSGTWATGWKPRTCSSGSRPTTG